MQQPYYNDDLRHEIFKTLWDVFKPSSTIEGTNFNVNARDKYGHTPIMIAMLYGINARYYLAQIKLLHQAGADLLANNKNNKTVLDIPLTPEVLARG